LKEEVKEFQLKLEGILKEFFGARRYCQVGITSSPPALMMLCIIAIAVTDPLQLP
jgi:hypothetical protein